MRNESVHKVSYGHVCNTGKFLIVVAGTAATLIVSLLSFILPYVN